MSLVNKKQVLTKMGFSPKTLSLMTESEISKLFKNFLIESKKETKEAVQVTKTVLDKNNPNDVKTANFCLQNPSDSKCKNVEMKESKKTSKKNPWAICTSVMGADFGTKERSEWTKKQMEKYEKCVVGVKKSIKEGKNPIEVLLEEKFRSIIVENLTPKITKKDILTMISEQPKPTTKPKPGVKPDTDTDYDPFINPDPDDQPEANAPEPTTKPKPGVKPDTDTDFDPFINPDPDDQPEASSKGLNMFMSFVNKMGMLKK
jgi:hypothetical protein